MLLRNRLSTSGPSALPRNEKSMPSLLLGECSLVRHCPFFWFPFRLRALYEDTPSGSAIVISIQWFIDFANHINPITKVIVHFALWSALQGKTRPVRRVSYRSFKARLLIRTQLSKHFCGPVGDPKLFSFMGLHQY